MRREAKPKVASKKGEFKRGQLREFSWGGRRIGREEHKKGNLITLGFIQKRENEGGVLEG